MPHTIYLSLLNYLYLILRLNWATTSFNAYKLKNYYLYKLIVSNYLKSISKSTLFNKSIIEQKYPLGINFKNFQRFNSRPVLKSGVMKYRLMESRYLNNLFLLHIKLNLASDYKNLFPQKNQKVFYTVMGKGSISQLAISKLYTNIKRFYNLMYNIYFYKLRILIFSNIFFKNEILSLNYVITENYKCYWRFIQIIIFRKLNKISNLNKVLFSVLTLLGIRLAVILDVVYHRHTLYYLRLLNFYIIGLGSADADISYFDFVVPSLNNNLPSQLYFVKLLLMINKNIENYKFTSYRNIFISCIR